MAKGSNFGLAIIGSVLITLILVAAGGYFALPLVFPSITAEDEDENVLLQSKLIEINDDAFMNDTIKEFELMNGTETSITIENNSRIAASFSGTFMLNLVPVFDGSVWFEISLVIEGVSNSTSPIVYFRETSSTDIEVFTSLVNINLMSTELNNGTYNIAVYWRSVVDPDGINSLSTVGSSGFICPRTLWVQELG